MSNIGTLTIEMAANIARLQSDMAQAKQVVNESMQSIIAAADLAKKAIIGFAGVASLDAFANMVRGNIEAAAAMGKLATQAGVTTEALSGLAAAGKLSGTGADAITAAMNKMTKAVSGTTEDAKGAGAALNALGISFSDFDKMSADQRMVAVAKAMDGFADGTGKSAVAMALMGKSGAEMLPYMKDLATVGELQAKVTTEQSNQARDFDLNLKRVKASSEAWKKEVSMGMLPALDEASKAWLQVMNGAGGLREEISKLAKDGTITDWTRSAITGITYLMDVFSGLKAVVVSVGDVIGAWLASLSTQFGAIFEAFGKVVKGDFGGALDTMKSGWTQQKAIISSLGDDLDKTWGEQTLGSKMRERIKDIQSFSVVAEDAKKKVNFNNSGPGGAEKADPQLKAYQDLIARIQEKISAQKLEAESGKKLTEAQQLQLEVQKLVEKGTITAAAASSTLTKAKLAELDAEEKRNVLMRAVAAADLAAAEAHMKFVFSLEQGLDKLQLEVKAQQEQNDRLGLSKEAIAALDVAKAESQALAIEGIAIKKLERDEDEYQYGVYKKQAQALRDLAAAKQQGAAKSEAIENFKAIWDSVDKTAHDVFVNIFQGGQDAFSKLRDVLKATLLDLLYQMTVRKWIFDITASVSGGGGVTGAAVQAATGGSALSGIGSLSGIASSAGVFGSGFKAGLGAVFGESGTFGGLSAGTTAIGAGNVAGGLGTLAGTALPWIGGAMLLKSLTDYKVTPTGSGLTATLGANGLPSGQVGTFSQYQQVGGLGGGGTTTNRDWGVADAGTTAYINDNAKNGVAAVKAYATAMGLNAAAVDGFTKSIEISTAGMNPEQAKKAIDEALGGFFDDMVSSAYKDLASLAQPGESATATLSRLATNLVTVNGVMASFGGTLYQVGVSGAAAASQLVAAFGNLQNMQAQISQAINNYATPAQQKALAFNAGSADLSKVGINVTPEQIQAMSREQVAASLQAYERAATATGATKQDQERFAMLVAVANRLNTYVPAWATDPATKAATDKATADKAAADKAAADKATADARAASGLWPGASSGGGGGGGDSGGMGSDSALTAWKSATDAIVSTMADLRKTLITTGVDSFAKIQAELTTKAAMAKAGDLDAAKDLPDLAKALIESGKTNSHSAVEQALLTARTLETLAGVAAATAAKSAAGVVGGGAGGGGSDSYKQSSYESEHGDPTLNWLLSQDRSGGYYAPNSFAGYHVEKGMWVPDGMPSFGSVANDGKGEIIRDPATGALKLHSFDVGTNFVPYDMTARVHAGEEITPRHYVDLQRTARDETNALLSRLVDSNAAMAQELASLRASADTTASATTRTAKTLDAAAYGGQPLGTVVMT